MYKQDGKTALDIRPLFDRSDIRPVLISFVVSTWHGTPIHKACYENDLARLDALIASDPASLFVQDHFGWTVLHVAAFMNRMEVFEVLVSRGADIFALTGGGSGHTAFHLACSRGHVNIVRWILLNVVLSDQDLRE